jgi:hypothetical protein
MLPVSAVVALGLLAVQRLLRKLGTSLLRRFGHEKSSLTIFPAANVG